MTPGVYVLVLELKRSGSYIIGKMGSLDFPSGFYCYAGSALNSLEARIERHLRQDKKLHWHIDYLLKEARIINVVYTEIPKKQENTLAQSQREECRIAKSLGASLEYIKGFGCSDCRCPSHLFYSQKPDTLMSKIVEAFYLIS